MAATHSENSNGSASRKAADLSTGQSWLEIVRAQVGSLRFGTVQITVHDSRVVQVERLEKLRLDEPKQH